MMRVPLLFLLLLLPTDNVATGATQKELWRETIAHSGAATAAAAASFGPETAQQQHYAAAAPGRPGGGALGISAHDFGAVGDGQTDDTFSLQTAIDASQRAGRALLIPAGTYLITRTLNVSCLSPDIGCARRRPGEDHDCCNAPFNTSCCTHQPAHIRGEGQALTRLLAAVEMHAVIDMGAKLNAMLPGNPQPHYNTTGYHEISDLHIQCDPFQSAEALKLPPGAADYGIFAPGITNTLFSRIRVNYARIAGARLFYCWINRFDNVNFNNNVIGIHSACNNLRVTGGNFDGHDIAGIMIDGGNAIEIDSNCIEGNSGPAAIVTGGIWGAPMGVSYSNNYHGKERRPFDG
jgi:hypothetical protein